MASTAPILMLRYSWILPSDNQMLFQTFSLCFSSWSLPDPINTFIFKKWFHDFTISSKQNEFIYFQSSGKSAHMLIFFKMVTALLLFHVFQYCNVIVLVFLFLLAIRNSTKFRPYELDSVMGENDTWSHCFLFCFYYYSNLFCLKVIYKVLLPRT